MSEVMYTLKNSPVNTDHHLGELSASVVIVEYGDFQCPHCAAAAPHLKQILKTYQDVCLIFRHLPLIAHHPHAGVAAVAAEAAAVEGKFWQMHDALFEHQDDLSTENIFAVAKKIGLNLRRFLNDLENEKLLDRVRDDITNAVNNGIETTPTIFINGVLFEGEVTFEGISQEVDQILRDNQTTV